MQSAHRELHEEIKIRRYVGPAVQEGSAARPRWRNDGEGWLRTPPERTGRGEERLKHSVPIILP